MSEQPGPPQNTRAPDAAGGLPGPDEPRERRGSGRGEILPLLQLGVPVALAHLANISMHIVDMYFVGKLGPAALGGVSIANAVYSTLLIVGIGLQLGLEFLLPHAWGSGKQREGNLLFVQAAYFALLLSAAITALMMVVPGLFPAFGIASEVIGPATDYLRPLALSMAPSLLFITLRQYLQSMNVATPVLLIMLAANGVNAFANWVLVLGNLGFPSLGVAGSAWATLVARLVALALLAWYILARDRRLGLGLRETPLALETRRMASLVKLGIPAGLQMLLEVGVFALATMLAGRIGAVPLAAHQIVLQVASFTFMIPLGLSSATAVRVANSVGAGHRASAVRVGWSGIGFGAAFMAASGVTLYLLSSSLLRAFTTDAGVIEVGTGLMLIAALFQLSDGVQVLCTGALRGIGNTRLSLLANLVGHWLVGLPISVGLCFVAGWQVRGLWIGLSAGLTSVALSLLIAWWRLSRAR
jgi:multidrug resistance protein, MATE family